MPTLLFYVSGHGFGHSTRTIAVINAIPPEYDVIVKTSAPQWLFDLNVRRAFDFQPLEVDVGAVQPNCLKLEREKTLLAFSQFVAGQDVIVRNEVQFARPKDIRAVVFDIPPLAPLVAQALGVPSIAISNFSWDEIYEPYVREFPQYQPLLAKLAAEYATTSLLLRLPFHLPMAAFPVREDWHLLTRVAQEDKAKLRAKMGLPRDEIVVLLSFGGFRLAKTDALDLASCKGFFFLSFVQPPLTEAANYRNLRQDECRHEEAVKASDIVITKPGYGIVSECIANQTAMLYTEREDFCEYPLLVEGIQKHLIQDHIPQDDLLVGRWHSHLERLSVRLDSWNTVEPVAIDDGSRTAARIIEMAR
ncbi:MAG TPA: hypothetical protein PKH07_01465 [bacterium]|nr:hypothetical protein [bacterium]